MLDFQNQAQADRIIVALDCGRTKALELADELCGLARWMKVGMTLFYQEGPAIVQALHQRGFKVFLDLKFHDIPHQVEGAAQAAHEIGADMITMHACGGLAMMQAAQKGIQQSNATHAMATLGVTVLTSMDEDTLHSVGVNDTTNDQIIRLAQLVSRAKLTGVVCSPQEAAIMRSILGPNAYVVTPGVRPKGASLDDQSRVMTPKEAFEQGASHLVIGRPITGAENPKKAFEEIVKGL